jgi:hypothetical protein
MTTARELSVEGFGGVDGGWLEVAGTGGGVFSMGFQLAVFRVVSMGNERSNRRERREHRVERPYRKRSAVNLR